MENRSDDADESVEGEGEPAWFREPSRRERWIAAGLFVGFGLFFIGLFIVQKNWWFRWVILGLGGISIIHGVRQALAARF